MKRPSYCTFYNPDGRTRHEKEAESTKLCKQVWKNKNPAKVQEYQLRSRFGLSLAQFNGMCDAQGWVCPICHDVLEDTNGKARTLCVDHDHDNDKVRGPVCDSCNKGLGLFKDRPELLTAAAAYLLKHKKSLFPVS